jgi:3-phosphoshikimate 1-carboxyvinyltransferase
VVGDISSAAFFLAAGLLAADGEVALTGVNTNPTRTGILDVIRAMGGHLTVDEGEPVSGEPQGTLRVRRSQLTGTRIAGALIPRLIDEIPAIAVMAALARGTTEIRDAGELRKKECDRIKALATELPKLGARVREEPDGLTIEGVGELTGAPVDSHDDHRIAMALAVAGLGARGATTIARAHCVDISYPEFWRDLARLSPRAVDPGLDPHIG